MTKYELYPDKRRRRRQRRRLLLAAAGVLVVGLGAWEGSQLLVLKQLTASPATSTNPTKHTARAAAYRLHEDITATMFWVGEPADSDNDHISNTASAWVGDWVGAFGGHDKPNDRCGYAPCGFTPRQNTFYFALPFNDYTSQGKLKPANVLRQIPWYDGSPPSGQSLVKNRWIAVSHLGKTAYGQWEDAGPFGEDDAAYVFGKARPQAKAGLDLSPAMSDYLHLKGEGQVNWHFVDAADVPPGPWKRVITSAGLDY